MPLQIRRAGQSVPRELPENVQKVFARKGEPNLTTGEVFTLAEEYYKRYDDVLLPLDQNEIGFFESLFGKPILSGIARLKQNRFAFSQDLFEQLVVALEQGQLDSYCNVLQQLRDALGSELQRGKDAGKIAFPKRTLAGFAFCIAHNKLDYILSELRKFEPEGYARIFDQTIVRLICNDLNMPIQELRPYLSVDEVMEEIEAKLIHGDPVEVPLDRIIADRFHNKFLGHYADNVIATCRKKLPELVKQRLSKQNPSLTPQQLSEQSKIMEQRLEELIRKQLGEYENALFRVLEELRRIGITYPGVYGDICSFVYDIDFKRLDQTFQIFRKQELNVLSIMVTHPSAVRELWEICKTQQTQDFRQAALKQWCTTNQLSSGYLPTEIEQIVQSLELELGKSLHTLSVDEERGMSEEFAARLQLPLREPYQRVIDVAKRGQLFQLCPILEYLNGQREDVFAIPHFLKNYCGAEYNEPDYLCPIETPMIRAFDSPRRKGGNSRLDRLSRLLPPTKKDPQAERQILARLNPKAAEEVFYSKHSDASLLLDERIKEVLRESPEMIGRILENPNALFLFDALLTEPNYPDRETIREILNFSPQKTANLLSVVTLPQRVVRAMPVDPQTERLLTLWRLSQHGNNPSFMDQRSKLKTLALKMQQIQHMIQERQRKRSLFELNVTVSQLYIGVCRRVPVDAVRLKTLQCDGIDKLLPDDATTEKRASLQRLQSEMWDELMVCVQQKRESTILSKLQRTVAEIVSDDTKVQGMLIYIQSNIAHLLLHPELVAGAPPGMIATNLETMKLEELPGYAQYLLKAEIATLASLQRDVESRLVPLEQFLFDGLEHDDDDERRQLTLRWVHGEVSDSDLQARLSAQLTTQQQQAESLVASLKSAGITDTQLADAEVTSEEIIRLRDQNRIALPAQFYREISQYSEARLQYLQAVLRSIEVPQPSSPGSGAPSSIFEPREYMQQCYVALMALTEDEARIFAHIANNPSLFRRPITLEILQRKDIYSLLTGEETVKSPGDAGLLQRSVYPSLSPRLQRPQRSVSPPVRAAREPQPLQPPPSIQDVFLRLQRESIPLTVDLYGRVINSLKAQELGVVLQMLERIPLGDPLVKSFMDNYCGYSDGRLAKLQALNQAMQSVTIFQRGREALLLTNPAVFNLLEELRSYQLLDDRHVEEIQLILLGKDMSLCEKFHETFRGELEKGTLLAADAFAQAVETFHSMQGVAAMFATIASKDFKQIGRYYRLEFLSIAQDIFNRLGVEEELRPKFFAILIEYLSPLPKTINRDQFLKSPQGKAFKAFLRLDKLWTAYEKRILKDAQKEGSVDGRLVMTRKTETTRKLEAARETLNQLRNPGSVSERIRCFTTTLEGYKKTKTFDQQRDGVAKRVLTRTAYVLASIFTLSVFHWICLAVGKAPTFWTTRGKELLGRSLTESEKVIAPPSRPTMSPAAVRA